VKIHNQMKYTAMCTVIFLMSICNAYASNYFVVPESITQNQTQAVSIPLTMNNLSNLDIRSIELNIAYDPDVLTATGVSLTGTVLKNENYLYEFNTNISGIIYALFASNASHFTGTGLCLYLDFTVIGTSGETTDISLSTAIVNNQTVSTSGGIFTVAPESPPMFTGITSQTMNEDASLSTSLTINDYESNPCDLTLTVTSSDETLVPANTISYTCLSGNYFFSITPVANQHGLATITIIAEDSSGLTASASFDLTVVSVNDAPVISANTSLTMNEDTSSAFSLTATDIDIAGCSLGITWHSSDAGILSDDNISYTCTGDIFHFSLTPVENQFGNVTLSLTITDSGSFTETHALGITVVEINDTPLMGMIEDQTRYAIAPIESLELTATDIETATCSMGMTIMSSNTILLPTSNIAYTCLSNSFYFTLTPVSEQVGTSTVTIVVTDSGGLTASTSFNLNINLPPELSIISDLGTAAGEISFTFVEADGDTVSLTVTSSDQSLIADANIQIVGGSGNTTILATSAYIEQSVSIQLNQESNVHGLATITVEASATGGSVTETFNVIVSPPGSGNALIFDGDDDFVSLGSISGSHPLALAGSHFSIGFWIKPTLMGDNSQRIIDKSTDQQAIDGYSLALKTNTRKFKFYIENLLCFSTDTNTITPNMWQHVVITADSSQYKCYVNGLAVGLSENSFALPPNATANLFIGTWYSETTGEFNGMMDEVSIWNRALSETEVRDYMCKRLSGDETGLLAYFRFDHFTGTTLTDLSGNAYHGTLVNMETTDWTISEIPLGDTSVYDYIGSVASDFSATLSHSNGDAFTAFGDSGSYTGLHVYLVNESPSSYTAPAGFSGLYTDHYFGVFPIGITPTYSIAYNYSGNTYAVDDSDLQIAYRTNNAGVWTGFASTQYPSTNMLLKTGIEAFSEHPATEFILGRNAAPVISSISPQTTDEDTAIDSIAFTATDMETASCDLNITLLSSDPILLSNTNLSYICDSGQYTITAIPETNQNGVATITVIVADSAGLTTSTFFDLIVSSVNDTPEISFIADQNMNEDTAINSINFTVTDIENANCSMDITLTSSDESIVPNANLSYVCNNNNYTITALPVSDQSGVVTITVMVTDSAGMTATKSFDLTVTAVNDPPVITSDVNFTMNEDATSILTLTATDAESADCSMDITFASSNTGLLTLENISYTCASGVYYISIMPENNQSGNTALTITITDSENLTATQAIALTVLELNDPPQMGSIADQSMNEGTSIALSLTATDLEGDSLSVTAISANQSLIQNSDILLTNDGSTYTITITPMTNQAGNTDITISVDDGTDITNMTFSITVNEIHYMIAGHVSSYTDIAGSDLEGVTLTLSGTHSYSMMTDATGYYTFTTVRPGDYTLTASKSSDINLDISDAMQILKAVVRKTSLTCLERIAADAYNDGYVGAYDASRVLDYLVGFENCLNDSCTFWQFIPENLTSCDTFPLIQFENARRYTDVTGDAIGQDFIGIGSGNVLE